MKVTPILGGALALVALQVVVTSPETGRIGALFGVPAKLARALIDATVPAIPQLSDSTGSSDTADTAAITALVTAPTPPARKPRTAPRTPATA